MDGKHGSKRAKLFDIYSNQFTFFRPDITNVFVCPVCFRGFTREQALSGPDYAVSLAHVIPDALGGRLRTLTCTACNNDGGSELEAHLVERFRFEDFAAGVGTQRARMVVGPLGSVEVEWENRPAKKAIDLRIIGPQSSPAHVEAIQRRFTELSRQSNGKLSLSLALSYRNYSRHISTALYQSAFLLMFSYFGYDFAGHPNYAPLRERLRNPKNNAWNTPIIGPSDGMLPKGEKFAVFFQRDPGFIVAIMRFRVKGGRERVLGVMLPGPHSPSPPKFEVKTFHGAFVHYRPDLFLRSKHPLQTMWRE
ncbi:MAG TPA: HNH endonuclease [Gemmataceae bacterium]|nr:HNH endonuclease [Gemmataceae bacterium]